MRFTKPGRTGDVMKWLQMVLEQTQSPRGQQPRAQMYGASAPVAAPVAEPQPMGAMDAVPPPMGSNPFDMPRRRRR